MEVATATNRWIDTIDSEKPEIIQKAQNLIINNIYCTLSTCSPEGEPWVSPVFFAYDEQWHIYWSSAIVSQHSQNIYHNSGRVAIAIFNSSVAQGSAAGVYLSGSAAELDVENIEKTMKLLEKRANKQLNRTVADYLDDSPRRIYKFQPQQVWLTGNRLAVGNQLVDTKIQINLASFLNLKPHI
ncbi:pyridoxamine 5'-phosphate oxidase family protein [Tolypothrix sp. FACHB-123]|uniref:pyridoxamine 5'-phosphate oxidase family protein n=1 Tax=Tolypothrix sp. FACHB-123 TaxID=2692868 RepID=UPI0016833D94|nr:pyridoxamine 5'-phosphate oxidase family protein [Tolypothrix sp. FACHB-123]MBD2353585.1 pyridoxamine 5'-phosphate oxidase family protein [Tolypothrix sp. FACHB-123]